MRKGRTQHIGRKYPIKRGTSPWYLGRMYPSRACEASQPADHPSRDPEPVKQHSPPNTTRHPEHVKQHSPPNTTRHPEPVRWRSRRTVSRDLVAPPSRFLDCARNDGGVTESGYRLADGSWYRFPAGADRVDPYLATNP